MPKSNVVFRVADSDDDSEDYVEVIPYVKPPPVVIDLLESESGDDSSLEATKSTPKKKNKKKKSKKRNNNERDDGTDSTSCSTSRSDTNAASESSPVANLVSQSNECLSDNSSVEEIVGSQDDEPTAPVEGAGGSGDVATKNNISSTGATVEAQTSAPLLVNLNAGASGSSSIFERCRNAQSTEVDIGQKVAIGTGMVGVSPSSARNDCDNRAKSKARKSKGEGRTRTRTMSATQRTNEEIVNFLTTLGIEMAPSAFDTPPTRRRQTRKRQPQPQQLATDEAEGNSRDSLATNSSDGSSFPVPIRDKETTEASCSSGTSYVSVTQDFNSPSKRQQSTPKSKGRQHRQAICGDISDFTISFTNKDLNAIATNIQSNVLLLQENDNRLDDSFIAVSSSNKGNLSSSAMSKAKSYYTDVIDAVAKGLDTSLLSSPVQHEKSIDNTGDTRSNDINCTLQGNGLVDSEIVLQKKNGNVHSKTKFGGDTGRLQDDTTSSAQNEPEQSRIPLTSEVLLDVIQVPVASAVVRVEVRDMAHPQGKEVESVTVAPVITESFKFTSTEKDKRVSIASGAPEPEPELISKPTKSLNVTQNIAREKEKTKEADTNPNSKRKKESGTSNRRLNLNEQPTSNSGKENTFSSRSPERKRRKANSDVISVKVTDDEKNDGEVLSSSGASSLSSECQTLTASISQMNIPPESYFPCSWTDHMKDFYGTNRNEEFEMDDIWTSLSDSRELWKAYKDMMPPPNSKRRHVRCDRCKQLGHLIKECKEKWKPPTCHYCGKVGHTSESHSRHKRSCPDALCLNCGRRSSRYAQRCTHCLLQSRPSRCEVCNVLGHDRSICPDNWRRYHSMTSLDDYEKDEAMMKNKSAESQRRSSSKVLDSQVYRISSDMYCSNCGRNGHTYYDCNASKFNTYPRNKPFVIRNVKLSQTVPPSTSTDAIRKRSKSAGAIPLSYDSRTGRTVVMNAEENEQLKLTVETIQVKITNDLALETPAAKESSFPVPDTSTTTNGGRTSRFDVSEYPETNPLLEVCNHQRCTNKLSSDEKCYQSLISAQAYSKLLKARNEGVLKSLEQKYEVQIYIIDDGSFKVHIAGSNALDADIDLHGCLGTLKTHQFPYRSRSGHSSAIPTKDTSTNNIPKDITIPPSKPPERMNPNPATSSKAQSIPVITVEEDEDECCVVIEVPVNESSNCNNFSDNVMHGRATGEGGRTITQTSPNSSVPCIQGNQTNQVSPEKNQSLYVDESPFVVEIDPSENTNSSEQQHNLENVQACSKSSWQNYVSPLTGMCLDVHEENTSVTTGNIGNISISNPSCKQNRKENEQLNKQCPNPNKPTSHENENNYNGYGILEVVETLDATSSDSTESIDYTQERGDTEKLPADLENDDQNSQNDDVVIDKVIQSNYEVITIDDDEEEPISKRRKQMNNENDVSVTLLQSEWDLVMKESAKRESVLIQVSNAYDVVCEVSKESSSIIIREGTKDSRKLAKDTIVSWLERQCLNTDIETQREYEVGIQHGTPVPGPSSTPKSRVLKLKDAHQCNLPGQFSKSRKRQRQRKKNKNKFKQSLNNGTDFDVSNSKSPNTSASSSPGGTPSKNKRKFHKGNPSSSLFNPRSPMHSPSPKKMKRRKYNKPSNNAEDFPRTPNQNNHHNARFWVDVFKVRISHPVQLFPKVLPKSNIVPSFS